MQTDTQAKEFDPNNDPAKLARIGAHVTKRLNANPLVQKVEHEDAQLYQPALITTYWSIYDGRWS